MKPGAASHWTETWDAIVREAYRAANGEHAAAVPLVQERLPQFPVRRIRTRAVALRLTRDCERRALLPPPPRAWTPEPEPVRREEVPERCPQCGSRMVLTDTDGFRSCLMCGTAV